MSQVVDSLDAARDAAARQAWRASYDAYSAVDRSTLTPEDLESFADAAWWTGELDDAIKHRERAYAGYSSAGDKLGAARLALTLSWDHEGRAAYAVSQGWFATAQRLLEGLPESVEHGRVILTEALGAMMAEGDLPKATELFERASEVGGRIGDRDVQMLAMSGKARALIMGGEVEQGLALHDEASAAAVCGELKPFATGLVYCLTISSCQDVGDFRRAAEWTEAANRWCDQADVSGFPGTCRLHRAEIMRLRGDWPAAEAPSPVWRSYGLQRARSTAPSPESRRRSRRSKRRCSGFEPFLRSSKSPSRSATFGTRALRRTSSSTSSTPTRSAPGAPRRSTRPCTLHGAGSCSPRRTGARRRAA